jgi:hypothetical protein
MSPLQHISITWPGREIFWYFPSLAFSFSLTIFKSKEQFTMTTATMNFAIPCEVMGRDPAEFLLPDIGPTWPQEAHEVTLYDLKPELENPEKVKPLMEQLDARGFAVIKSKDMAKGPLAQQKEWNKAFLEVCRMPFVLLDFMLSFRCS